MSKVTIIASVHIKSLNTKQDIIDKLKSADLVIEEGVSSGNKFKSLQMEPALFLWWEMFSRLPIFNDIKTSRKISNNSKRVNVDTDFTTLLKHFYRKYHIVLNILLFISFFIGLLFLPYLLLGIVNMNYTLISFSVFGFFMFSIAPTGLFFLWFLKKTSIYRNDFVISAIKKLCSKYNNIVIIYGAKHTKDLYAKLMTLPECTVEVIHV